MSSRIVLKELFPPMTCDIDLEEFITYKVLLQASPLAGVAPRDVMVEAWTNQCDDINANGDWHAVRLSHLGTDCNSDTMSFGNMCTIVRQQNFEFTFRAKVADDNDYTWLGAFQQNGQVRLRTRAEEFEGNTDHVTEPGLEHMNCTHILNAVHCGDAACAENAASMGFTHVLNVADDLDLSFFEHSGYGAKIVYKKVRIPRSGGNTPIRDDLLFEAVSWLQTADQPSNKVLVCSGDGKGRSGSVVLAFVFASNRSWGYEICKHFVSLHKYIAPQVGLRESLYRLYPRA